MFFARLALPLLLTLVGCTTLQDMTQVMSGDPSSGEVVSGLKQALSKGTAQAVTQLAKDGGYSTDSIVRIPFPEQASFAADALKKLGMGGLVQDLEQRLNQGAEAGAKRALPIFEDAIRSMSFTDARGILFGGEHAATDYFHDRMYDSLVAAFRPEIDAALGDVGATEIWTEIATQYNRIPLLSKKVDTDLVQYATGRALDGLFQKLAAEEASIRADPVARSTALLQKVFGYAQKQAAGTGVNP